MAAPYNLTGLETATTVSSLVTFANDITDTYWVGFLMIAIFFVLLVSLKRYDFENAILSSGFVCFILSSILTYAGYLNFIFPLLFLITMALAGFWNYMANRE